MSINFIPGQEEYKNITPFKGFVLQNFPYIDADFDALTNYELYCKIVGYLNDVISNENTVENNVTALYNAFTTLNNYVSDYFNNLDVQDEINNKLDDMVMSGVLQELLSEQYNDLRNEVNGKVTILENELRSVASGSPLKANSINDMTDTTKTYVLVTDGNWYYYNGSNWVIGGVYQATEIQNGSIDFRKLDEELNGLFYKGITRINPGSIINGHFKTISNGHLVDNLNSNWGYYQIDISQYQGKVLFYTTTSFASNYSLILTDNSENVLFNVENVGYDYKTINGYVYIPIGAKYLFSQTNISDITYNTNGNINRHVFAIYGIVNNLKQILNYNKKTLMTNIESVDSYFLNSSNQSVGNLPYINYIQNSSWKIKVYKINKGLKYEIIGENYQLNSGFIITDNNYKSKIVSTLLFSQGETYDYIFNAEYDGYIIVADITNHSNQVYVYDEMSTSQVASKLNTGVVRIGDGLDIDQDGVLKTKTDFSDLKIGFTGDSICYGAGYTGGYSKILHDNYNLNVQNIGVSGGHITHDRDDVFLISNSINDLDNDCDAIIMEGGINDQSNYVNFGSISNSYSDTVDQTTFCGAMEKMFRDCYTLHPGKKFAFIIIHNVTTRYVTQFNEKTWEDYVTAIYKLCRKYGVDIIDIGYSSMNTYLQTMKNNYTLNIDGSGDGLHPNKQGYEKFYVPKIVEWIKSSFNK